MKKILAAIAAIVLGGLMSVQAQEGTGVRYRKIQVEDCKIFYREAATWLPVQQHHVPGTDAGAGGLLSPHCTGFPVFRTDGIPGTRQVHLFFRSPCPYRGQVYRETRSDQIRHVCLRLWRSHRLPARHVASGANHRHHLAERQHV